MLYALAAGTTINANGNFFITDSFNSSDSHLSTQGFYDAAKISTNGDVAASQGIINIGGGSHIIDGNLFLGPMADFVPSTNTISTNPVLGSVYTNRTLNFPEVALPPGSPIPAPFVSNTNRLTTSGYYSVNNSSAIDVAAGVIAAVLVTTPNFNSNIQIDGGMTNSGTVHVYFAGTNATLSQVSSFRARNVVIYGLPSLADLTLSGTMAFSGIIYAPSTDVVLSGGGNTQTIIGACIAKSITLYERSEFHFDEDLLNLGQFP